MAINSPQWNLVRASLGADERQLFERVEREINEDGQNTRTVFVYEPATASNQSALSAFAEIEADVERLIQEVNSLQTAERELRAALEEPGGAETQRR